MRSNCEEYPNDSLMKEKVIVELDAKIIRKAKKHKINIEEAVEEHLKTMRGTYL